jgi:hypothetical protein
MPKTLSLSKLLKHGAHREVLKIVTGRLSAHRKWMEKEAQEVQKLEVQRSLEALGVKT